MKTRVSNLRADDPQDPIEILRKKWETERMNISFCCDALRQQIITGCSHHGWSCPDYLIQIGITGFNKPRAFWCGAAGNASYEISFCPFCGTKLPELKDTYTKEDECCGCCNHDKSSCAPKLEKVVIDEGNDKQVMEWADPVFVEDDISKRLREMLAEHLLVPSEKIKPETLLVEDLGADDLDIVEITMAAELMFDVELDDVEIDNCILNQGGLSFQRLVEMIRLRKIVLGVPSEISDDEDDYEESYLKGLQDGLSDKGKSPKYIKGDELGADSRSHAKYIEGYLTGFAS